MTKSRFNTYTRGGTGEYYIQTPIKITFNPIKTNYDVGQLALNTVSGAWFIFQGGTFGWVPVATSGTASFTSLTVAGPVNLNTTGAATTSIGTGGTGAVNIGNTTGNTGVTGALNITTGNLVFNTIGNKIIIPTGTNAAVGTSAAMTAGAVTVATTSSSSSAKIFYSRTTAGGTTGNVSITAQSGTGFTLTSSSNTETSTFNWWIINA